LKPFI